MTPKQLHALLIAAGEALYGARWQAPLAADLGVNDRTMRRWVAEDNDIPAAVAGEMRELLKARRKAIDGILRE